MFGSRGWEGPVGGGGLGAGAVADPGAGFLDAIW